MNILISILYYGGFIISGIFFVLPLVTVGLEIYKKIKEKKDTTKGKKVFIAGSVIVAIIMAVIMYAVTKSYVVVPETVGKIYADAKDILINRDLDFNTEYGKEQYKVLAQEPKSGYVVKRDTIVELTLEETVREPEDTKAPTSTPTDTPKPEPTNTPISSPTTKPMPEHVHVWKTNTTKEATCISTGEKIKKCDCGASEIEIIALTKHDWTDASCTEAKTCKYCEKKEGTPLGHKEEIVNGYAATCTATGLTDGKTCSRCREIIVRQVTIEATEHKYDNDNDAECNDCGSRRAVWHYFEQWDNETYGDWELYNVEEVKDVKTVIVDTYIYRTYYWVDSTGDYRATGPSLLAEKASSYTFNKFLSGKEASEYGGVTTGTDTYITRVSNGKYNIQESQVFYSPQGFVKGSNKGVTIDGITYWEEVIGSEVREETYIRKRYCFRKFY